VGKDLLDSNLQSVLPTPSPGGTESQDEGKPGARCGTFSETPRKALVWSNSNRELVKRKPSPDGDQQLGSESGNWHERLGLTGAQATVNPAGI